jgi:pimeloyl-ACP methyl ester carboxylesterase
MDAIDLKVTVADHVRLHVRHWPAGPPGRTPFLLVHGLASNARLWDGVARELGAAGHPAYAVDLRSHGESDQPADGYDTPTAAADLAALTARLDLPPAVVAGQSWGGNVVVAFAAGHPSSVLGLALIDGGWIELSKQFDSWQACAQALRPPDLDGMTPDELRDRIRRSHPDWADWAVDATAANLRVEPDGSLVRPLPVPYHMQILRSLWDDPPVRHFPSVTMPTLLVPAVGRDTEQAARRRRLVLNAAAMLPNAEVREYHGDHDLHAQQPQRLARDLLTLVPSTGDGSR